ncbi:IclR family transcriptional regulator [Acidicapsa ligni]|uniref:IclR family transcriptional regulator n=1 Tax=Acidicapsa ligni TaxID=542300 RepID=UPI0021DFAE72|nr:IclR family transcriptional regulator [Acidicapsa ligni]
MSTTRSTRKNASIASHAKPEEMKSGKKSTYSVPALEKGLDILEALASAHVPQSLTLLARRLKRTPSELFRMLDTLEKRSFIARDPISDGYHLTLKLYELAHTHSPVDQLLKAAMIPMYELAEKIHESCHLCVLNGTTLVVIAQAESPEPVRLSVEVGDRVQPLRTASGRVLTAFLDEAEQTRLLSADATYTTRSKKERAELATQLKQIQREGFLLATSTRRTGLDASCIVGNPQIGVLAALGVPFLPGSANDGKERELIPIIQSYADRITSALGLTSAHAFMQEPYQ